MGFLQSLATLFTRNPYPVNSEVSDEEFTRREIEYAQRGLEFERSMPMEHRDYNLIAHYRSILTMHGVPND